MKKTTFFIGLVISVLVLSACNNSTITSVAVSTSTSVPATPTPLPTATNIPSGWQILSRSNFTVGYPAAYPLAIGNEGSPAQSAGVSNITYIFSPPTGTTNNSPSDMKITVTTGVSAAFITQRCGVATNWTNLSGLAVFPYVIPQSDFRGWEYIDDQNNAFIIGVRDLYSTKTEQAKNNMLMATFRPISMHSGCTGH